MNDFGGKLRQAREARGLSLRQIADRTKIGVAALEALERNDVSRLPAGIFSRGFVRSYAIEVGLPPDDIVKEFLEHFSDDRTPPPPSRTFIPEPQGRFASRGGGRAVITLAVTGLVLAGAGYFGWKNRDMAAFPGFGTAVDSAGVAVPGVAALSGTAQPAGARAVDDGPFTLDLHPTADCWVRLTVDGIQIMSRVMLRGERASHRVPSAAVVEVGDAAAFAYSVDGRPGRPLGEAGQLKAARITQHAVTDYRR